MKITIIAGHFMPELGYQEVYLARAFSRLGHQVRVVASTDISPSGKNFIAKNYDPGLSKESGYDYDIFRLRPTLKYRSKVLVRGLKKAVMDFQPDTIVLLALAKWFPVPLLDEEISKRTRLIAICGDAFEYQDQSKWLKKTATYFQGLELKYSRENTYRKVVRFCESIILNSSESETIFSSYLKNSQNAEFLAKRRNLTLGYDPEEFYFNAAERQKTRNSLNIEPDETVFVTATRIKPRKNIELLIELLSQLKKEGKKVRYILVGFFHDEYSQSLKTFIQNQENPEIFCCCPILSHNELRCYYNASDIGIWLKATISIQEAMGTGLPIILQKKSSVNHLITEGKNGWFAKKGQMFNIAKDAVESVSRVKQRDYLSERRHTQSRNALKFSYQNIAKKILT